MEIAPESPFRDMQPENEPPKHLNKSEIKLCNDIRQYGRAAMEMQLLGGVPLYEDLQKNQMRSYERRCKRLEKVLAFMKESGIDIPD